MQTGQTLLAKIPPTRKRPVYRARNAMFLSCYQLGKAGRRVELSQIIIAHFTAQE